MLSWILGKVADLLLYLDETREGSKPGSIQEGDGRMLMDIDCFIVLLKTLA